MKSKIGYSIHEVIENTGPVCASNEEFGFLITVNGAYLNLWGQNADGTYTNTDCQSRNRDLYNTTGDEMIDEAKRWAEEIVNGTEND